MDNIPTRSNNPGDIKDPTTGNFRQFSSPMEGKAALYNDLTAKMTGTSTTGIGPDSSLVDFSKVYAPAADKNDPLQYAANLANQMGISPDTKIGTLKSRIDDFAGAVSKNEGYVEKPTSSYPGSTASTPQQSADQASAQKYGAPFAADTSANGIGGMISEGAKTAGNFLPSLWGFAKNTFNFLNPINSVGNLIEAGKEFGGLANDMGAGNALGSVIGQTPDALGQVASGLIPESAKSLWEAGKGFVTNNDQQLDEGLANAQRSITNDPFGQVAPWVFAAEAAAKGGDAISNKMAMSDYVDNIAKNIDEGNAIPQPKTPFSDAFGNTISTIASPVTKPFDYAFGKGANFAGSVAKGGYSKFTGFQPNDLDTIARNAGQFTPENIAAYDRSANASTISDALDKRISDLGETGAQYNPIREAATTVPVDPEFLLKQIVEKTGLDYNPKTGSFEMNGGATIRTAGDLSKLNNFFKLWNPYFDNGSMTSNEFLNMRSDLASMKWNESGIGKSGPLEDMGGGVRNAINNEYRPSINGLENTDATYASQIQELNALKSGLLDKNGTLLSSATNKIANALGKGKSDLISQLEQISPGITEKIAVGKAMEAAQALQGNVVGTYGRTAGTLGAGVAGGALGGPLGAIAAAIVEHILSSPEVTVKVLQAISKVPPLYEAVTSKLASVNALPAMFMAQTNKEGTPTAFTPK